MAEWARVVNTTTRQFLKGETVEVLRNRKLLAILNDRGRVTYNHSGTDIQWQVRFKQAPLVGYDDADTMTFSRINRWKNGVLPWRGYVATDSMTKKEKEINKGTEALVKVYSQIASMLMQDIEEQFGDQLYIDGNASGNSKLIHGIESFMGVSSTVSSSPVGNPSDTYAGLSTALGNYGGSWSGNWPTGTGDAHYDFFSPTIVDYTNSLWGFSSNVWANTCIPSLRFGIIKGKKNKSKRGQLDLILLNDELYRPFLERLQLEEHLHVQPNNGSSGLWKLGFTDLQNFDGVDVTYEYGVPANVGYGWCMNLVELCSLQSDLFIPEGPDFDISSQSWRFSIDFLGNLKFEAIRNFLKWIAIS